MHARKLVKAGQTSHTVSLPKQWLAKNNLSRGSTVYIKEKSDRELVITPHQTGKPTSEKKEITIDVEKKEPGQLQRELTSAYVNNYSSMVFTGKDISQQAKAIRNIIQEFVALEVAEHTANKIVVKDFLNLEEISIEQTLRRMDMILRSMLKDAVQSLEQKQIVETIQYKDADVNKLYFLLFRLLKSALQDQRIAENFSLSNADILSQWYLIVNLENIADCVKNSSLIFAELEKNHKKTELTTLYKDIHSSYEQTMKAFFSKDKKQAEEVAKNRVPIFEKCENYFKHNKTLQTASLMEQWKEMETLICNVAKIVIDHE